MSDPVQLADRHVDVFRRLRVRPPSSWSVERVAVARKATQELADLGADAAGEPRRQVPDLHPTALADQLEVLLAEAVAAGVDPTILDRLVEGLAAALAVR